LIIPNSSDWSFGAGDFTIDLWVRLFSTGMLNCLVGQWNGSGGRSFLLSHEAGKLAFYISTDGSIYHTVFDLTSGITPDVWYHVAVSRYGNTCTGYVDGISIGTGDMTGITLYTHPTQPLSIGGVSIGSGYVASYGLMDGYIDDLRITKGISRYTANFTRPVAQFEA
jgi:hypothetical protein